VPPAGKPRLKLKFLDGLRGLAALYVVLFHQYSPREISPALAHWLVWMRFGHYAVAVFIVLSGYSLMIPIVLAGDGRVTGGMAGFFKRRARRILPPYYFALAATLAITFVSRHLMAGLHMSTGDKGYDSAFQPMDIITHLLVIHNWFREYNFGINGTHWSVATEWQIYFLFALFLLPVWRRFGSLAAVGAGLALGIAPLLLLPRGHNLAWASPQYLGLFAFGMAGAAFNFSDQQPYRRLRDRVPCGLISALLFGLFLPLAMFGARRVAPTGELDLPQPWVADVLVGLAAVFLICSCTRSSLRVAHKRQPLVLRFLECGWVTRLGTFSYSIYLISLPIEGKVRVAFYKLTHSDPRTSAAMFFIGIPITLVCCYLFHLAFERPFMSGIAKKKTTKDVSLLPPSE
jgi:peptidoglycan/LPS O-acetylase OafA/YrhL